MTPRRVQPAKPDFASEPPKGAQSKPAKHGSTSDDEQTVEPDEPLREVDDSVYGEWVVLKPSNPNLLSRQLDKVVEVWFKNDTVKLNEDTLTKAKRMILHEDFRNQDSDTLSKLMNNYYNTCQAELFDHLPIKTIAYSGKQIPTWNVNSI